ncbi:MAG: hypothetical protein FJ112_00425 [Deltaproteobacteria bacterium]|nr:hypothetical protein [Deltaproteobacteria bacterium]
MRLKKIAFTIWLLTIPFEQLSFGHWIESYYECFCSIRKNGAETSCLQEVNTNNSEFREYLTNFPRGDPDPQKAVLSIRTAFGILEERVRLHPEESVCLKTLTLNLKYAGIFAGHEKALAQAGWLIRISALRDFSKKVYSEAQQCFGQKDSDQPNKFKLPNPAFCY